MIFFLFNFSRGREQKIAGFPGDPSLLPFLKSFAPAQPFVTWEECRQKLGLVNLGCAERRTERWEMPDNQNGTTGNTDTEAYALVVGSSIKLSVLPVYVCSAITLPHSNESESESESRSVMSDSLWPHGLWIVQARILEWVVLPFSRGSSQPMDQTQVSHIVGGVFTSWATREDHT